MLVFLFPLIFSSCKKTCPDGYEGNDCKTLSRSKFLGKFYIKSGSKTGTCNTTAETFSESNWEVVDVSAVNNVNGDNIHYITVTTTYASFRAYVNESSFTFNDSITDFTLRVNGSGSMDGEELSLDYVRKTQSSGCLLTFTGKGKK